MPSGDPHEPDSAAEWTEASTGSGKSGMSTSLLDAPVARLRHARSKRSGQLSSDAADGLDGRLTVCWERSPRDAG